MTPDDLLRRPSELTGHAAEHWEPTAPHLAKLGILNPDTRERLRRACCVHAEAIRLARGSNLRRHVAATRLYFHLIRGLGTTPGDRVRLVLDGLVGPEHLPGRGRLPSDPHPPPVGG